MFTRAIQLPFKLLGIPLLLDWTFLIILPLMAWLIAGDISGLARQLHLGDVSPITQGAWPYIIGLIAAVGLFLSVVIHELGHAVVGRIYGVRTKSITLWALGGVAQFDEMPRQRGAEAIVAIVGPIVSMVLGALFAILWFSSASFAIGFRFVFAYLTMLNFSLAVFNLLPALPLDGGRVLRSLLALRMPHFQATQVSASISRGLAILLGIAGLMFNPWFIAIAFFIYIAVNSETQHSLIFEMLRGIKVDDLMTRPVKTVSPEETVAELTARMFREHHLGFPVVDGQQRLLGIVTLANLQGADPSSRVGQVMTPTVATIGSRASALDAFHLMGQNNFGRLVVMDDGQLQGIITKSDLMRAIQLRMAGLGMTEASGTARGPYEPYQVGAEAQAATEQMREQIVADDDPNRWREVPTAHPGQVSARPEAPTPEDWPAPPSRTPKG